MFQARRFSTRGSAWLHSSFQVFNSFFEPETLHVTDERERETLVNGRVFVYYLIFFFILIKDILRYTRASDKSGTEIEQKTSESTLQVLCSVIQRLNG